MNNTVPWRPTWAEEFARFLAFYTAVVASEHLQVSEKVALIEDAATEFLTHASPHHIKAIVQRLADNPWRKTGGAKLQKSAENNAHQLPGNWSQAMASRLG